MVKVPLQGSQSAASALPVRRFRGTGSLLIKNKKRARTPYIKDKRCNFA
jgi:hypothetical protein